MARYLLAPPAPNQPRAQIESVKLRLTKRGALPGFAVPGLEIERERAWCVLETKTKAYGKLDVIYETKDAGIYRHHLTPGQPIALHMHREMRESEMILTDGLLCQGKKCPAGAVYRWPLGAAHGYENPSEYVQSILCVARPRFLEHDVTLVDGDPADVVSEVPLAAIPRSSVGGEA